MNNNKIQQQPKSVCEQCKLSEGQSNNRQQGTVPNYKKDAANDSTTFYDIYKKKKRQPLLVPGRTTINTIQILY